jgi:hypothetical protein
MRSLLALLSLITIFLVSTTAFADDPTGYWCRSNAGNLLDVINVTRQGEALKVSLREGWDKPIYSEGVATFASNRLTATLKGQTKITHVPMTISGDHLSYTAYNMDGSFHWKGNYIRCTR